MSVEKIAPLSHSPVDAVVARPDPPHPLAPPPRPVGAVAAQPPADPGTPANFFDSIALPLPAQKTRDDAGAVRLVPGAPYAREATLAHLEQLIEGRLPPMSISLEVAALLRNAANGSEMSIARLIAETATTAPDALPSRNIADAQFSFHAPILARDDDGEMRPLVLYLTRAGARQWEAAVFRRDDDAAGPGFPHSAPPIDVYRLVIDPSTGQILASVAQQILPRDVAPPTPARTFALDRALRIAMFLVAAVAVAIILAKTLSKIAALSFLVVALALAINVPAAPATRDKGALKPSRLRRS